MHILSEVVAIYLVAAGSSHASTTFLCRFELTDLAADHAAGSAAPLTRRARVGPDGKWGYGLHMRQHGELTYPVAKNLSFDQGALSMWVKPLWSPASEGRIRCFWQTSANRWNGQMVRLTYWPMGGVHVIRLEVRHGRTTTLHGDVSKWRRGEWHHLAWTWRRRAGEQNDEIALYLDGKLVARSDQAYLPTRLGDRMFVGSNMNGPGRNECAEAVIDELCIRSEAKIDFSDRDEPCRLPVGIGGRRRPNFVTGLVTDRLWRGNNQVRVALVNLERDTCESATVEVLDAPPFRVNGIEPGKRVEATVSTRLTRDANAWEQIKVSARVAVQFAGEPEQELTSSRVIQILPPEDLPLREADRQVNWALPLPYRVNVLVDSAGAALRWKEIAGQVTIDWRRLLSKEFGVAGSYVDMNSVRVVPCAGEAGPILRRVEDCIDGRYRVSWRMKPSAEQTRFSIYFDRLGDQPQMPPERLPLVGNGDRITFGRGDTCGWLGGGFHASADAADLDGDGDLDLVVNYLRGGHPNWTHGGLHLYYNVGTAAQPKFLRVAKIREVTAHPQLVDYDLDGVLDIVSGQGWWRNEGTNARPALTQRQSFPNVTGLVVRVVDWDGDGKRDLIAGTSDRTRYWPKGKWWTQPYPRFTPRGGWKGGPQIGHIWFYRNVGTEKEPKYAEREQLMVPDGPAQTFGKAAPTIVDWDGDGDLDLICGEILDALTYFENVGTRTAPKLTFGQPPQVGSKPTAIGCIICPMAVDLDTDGDYDLIVGGEDGHVTYIENIGDAQNPKLAEEGYLPQLAAPLKAGCLAVPVS